MNPPEPGGRVLARELTAQRVAQNQSIFRAANEEIEAAAEDIRADLPRIPFICECPDTNCTQTTLLSFDEYEAIRANATHFLVLPGHETCIVDGEDVAQIHARRDTHTVMEKINAAAREARRQDSRTP